MPGATGMQILEIVAASPNLRRQAAAANPPIPAPMMAMRG